MDDSQEQRQHTPNNRGASSRGRGRGRPRGSRLGPIWNTGNRAATHQALQQLQEPR